MSVSKTHYLSDYLAVAREDVEQALGLVPNNGEVSIDEALDTVAITTDVDLPGSRAESRGEISQRLGLLSVDDPGVEVAQLVAQGINATAIHVIGLASHWVFAPGTDPEWVVGELSEVPDADDDRRIGVIDSGFVPGGPPWLNDYIDFDDPYDIELSAAGSGEVSHGTFIAGLLRQLACTHRVSTARLPLVHPDMVTGLEERDLSATRLSTELHLLEAMFTLCDRHSAPPDALNLSLGTYTANDLSTFIMRLAINYWYARTGGQPIFAAGGNEYEQPGDPYSPFWPAAFADVTAVGAARPDGSEVVWDYHNPTLSGFEEMAAPSGMNRRPWINRLAPGTDVIGLSGRTDAKGSPRLVKWSGSSFAAPVALAMHLRGVSTNSVHTDVEGLTYQGSAAIEEVPWGRSPCAPPVKVS